MARRSRSLPYSELLEETGAQLDLAGGDVDLDEGLGDVINHVEPLLVQVGRLDIEAEADEVSVRKAVAEAGLDPPSDVHATADYRRHLAQVLAWRAVRQALGEA